jgi:hypothetical protein
VVIREIPVGIFQVTKAKFERITEAASYDWSAYIPEINVGISKYHHSVISWIVPGTPKFKY